jgi:hypothetical protein
MNTDGHTDSEGDGDGKSLGSAPGESLMKGELPRLSNVEPEIVKNIVKLDDRSMVWAHDQAASDVEALAPFTAIVLVFMVLVLAPMFLQLKSTDLDGWAQKIILPAVGLVLLPATLAGAWLFVKMAVKRYAGIHFNRRTRNVYTQEGKDSVRLDWSRVRPFAIPAVGPLTLGAPPLWSLTLIEFSATDPTKWVRQMRVQGLLPDRDSCQRVWEGVRRYMDEAPTALPALEVLPDPGRSWQGAILDFGPAQMFDRVRSPEDAALGATGRLRRRHWWPAMNPMIVVYWIAFWPAPLSDILYQRFRPRARLPADWTSEEEPAPGEQNPYRRVSQPPDVAAGRRKATWIIGTISGVCIAIGIALWTLWLGTTLVPWTWGMWRSVFAS